MSIVGNKHREASKQREQWIANMPDKELRNTAVTLVYIMLGERALKLLTESKL